MPSIGFSFNMIVLFAFLLALGIVVDDAIVVIENTHRLFANGKRDIKTAAKMAAGEVFCRCYRVPLPRWLLLSRLHSGPVS